MSLRGGTTPLRLALALVACALCFIVVAAPAGAATARKAQAAPGTFAPDDAFTAVWTRAQALKVRLDPTNTKPKIPPDFPVMSNEVWVWDTWPLTNLNTEPISYQGWNIIFSLVAPRTIGFTERHQVATIGFFYSRDAKSWRYGGTVFPGGRTQALGTRQWAGSAVLTGDEVNLFYTASGSREGLPFEEALNDPNWLFGDTEQRLAHATARIRADENGVWFAGRSFRNSRIIAEADGRMYQTEGQSRGAPIIYAFRDPFAFRDRVDGEIYIAFEGNTAGRAGQHTCTSREIGPVPPGHEVPAASNLYTGNIGLARATSANLRRWQLLAPLVSANCVNQQLERPHFVFHEGKYYLFTISHTGTYAPGLSGPDGVYGFIGPSLRSDYKPLNASALVLGNPADAPFQQYSEYVMPNWLVEAFIDNVPTPTGIREGGTLAPTIQLGVEDSNTYVLDALDYGFIPAMRNAGGSLEPGVPADEDDERTTRTASDRESAAAG
jgi:levansucrase